VSTPGRFLVVEGIDGCGKSTQAARIAKRLDALLTFEPGATKLGAQVRQLVLGLESKPSDMAEVLLISADRAQHVDQVIEPALISGRDVVSDRFSPSTIAYQGWGRKMAMEDMVVLVELATRGRRAHLTLLFDLPVEIAAKRRQGEADRMEREEVAFHERVRAGYLAQAAAEPERWVVIDASRSLEEVSRVVDEVLVVHGCG
jgi:dTMP kinase